MRPWRVFEEVPGSRRTGAVCDSLAAWLQEALRTIPAGPVEVETNLGGLDEAGAPNPDFDWIGIVVDEFPDLRVRVTYRVPTGREDALAPYEVRLEGGDMVRRAWVEVTAPGRWVILEE